MVTLLNQGLVRVVKILLRTSVIVLAMGLENIFYLFGVVFGAQRVCQLHLSLGEHLLFQIADLALLVVRGAFVHGDQRAVVLIVRADGHVIETAI